MRRLFIALLMVMTLGSLAQAQTTVNLSVIDTPDNQSWNSGTWSVQLIPGPGNLDQTRNFTLLVAGGSLGSQSGALSGTGTASMSLPANVNIGPVGTKWQFTVCSQQGTACSTANITITTSSPQSVTISPPSIRVTANPNLPPVLVYTTTEISSASIGSQITVVGSTPSTPTLQTCTVVSGTTCTTWTGVGGPSASENAIFAKDKGVVADGLVVYDAGWTSGANPVVVTSATAGFLASRDNNKSCFGIDSTTRLNTAPLGTLTVVNSTTANCSGTATATSSASAFAWGTDDTVAWLAVNAAAAASVTPTCIIGPNGNSLISKAPLIDPRTTPTWDWCFSGPTGGLTTFIPEGSSFVVSTCKASGLGSCIWEPNPGSISQTVIPQYAKIDNIAVNGLTYGCTVSYSGKTAFGLTKTEGHNIWAWNWCTAQSGFSGITLLSPNSVYNLNANATGTTGILFSAVGFPTETLLATSYAGAMTGGTDLTINTGNIVVSKGNSWQSCGNQCINVQSGGTLVMDGDIGIGSSGIQYIDVAGTLITTGGTAVVISNNTAGTPAILTRATGKAFLKDTTVTVGGAGTTLNINLTTGGSIINRGNVTLTGADQTALVAANVVLSAGWGTTASVGSLSGTPLSNPTRFQFTATSAGTGQAANPTMAITYPGTGGTFTQPYWTCKQTGGTGTNTSITGEGTATTTSMTLTFNGTPVATSTYQITCQGSLL